MSDIIQTVNLKRGFKTSLTETFWALKGINITVEQGKLTIVRGRSGSGKTTLINILGALDQPSEGEVYFNKTNICTLSDGGRDKIRRKDIGFIFQSVALVSMMSAFENVEFGLRIAGYSKNRADRVEQCLRLVGLGQRMRHMPQELSGGEQQRVAIARAIAHSPKIIFADEPTAELDTNTGLQVVKIFKDLIQKEGLTIVMSTHDPGLMDIADCVYEIEDGEIISERN